MGNPLAVLANSSHGLASDSPNYKPYQNGKFFFAKTGLFKVLGVGMVKRIIGGLGRMCEIYKVNY